MKAATAAGQAAALDESRRPLMLIRLKRTVRDQPLLRAGVLRAGALVRSMAAAPAGIYPLCYHHVAPEAQAGFAAQLRFLRGFGTFVDADEALRRIEAGRAAEGRCFVLTFDDGYRDNVEVAMPVIREQGIPAMLFVVSDWIVHPPADGRAYMDDGAVRRWLAAGLDVGSHGASHRRYSGLSASDAEAEMRRSAAALADLCGRTIRHFACPWGVAGDDFLPGRDVALAVAAGYRTFFTTQRGHVTGPGSLPVMPRHVLEPEWPLYQLHTLMGGRALGR